MLAIINWVLKRGTTLHCGIGPLYPLLILYLTCGSAGAEVTPPLEAYAKAAETRYIQSGRALQKHPDNPEVAWKHARACFDWADFSTSKKERAERGQHGIDACRDILQKHPNLAPAHYYLGLNLGQLARTKTLGALSIVRKMEEAFLKTIELDPKFDHAGAHRNLGLLYRDAPGWPASIGSRTKARFHLKQTLVLFPNYPGNVITFLQSQLEWGEKQAVRDSIPKNQKILEAARDQFTGEEWTRSWDEWQTRWKGIQETAGVPVRPIGAPSKR